MIFPSRYAHLPTKENEYEYILKNIYDGISVGELDYVIARSKNKEYLKKPSHYRTNLKNLGVFEEIGSVVVNENIKKYKKGDITLKETLKLIVEKNEEIMYIKNLAEKNNIFNYNLNELALVINNEFENRSIGSIIRWFRPVTFLIRYTFFENNNPIIPYLDILKKIEEEYFKIAENYGDPVAIEALTDEIKKIYPHCNMDVNWEKIFYDVNLRYKLSFITLPNWATKYKTIAIEGNIFTHIRIKKTLIGVDRIE